MQTLTLKPLSHIQGEVNIPGSKSLSNRILLLSALAQGDTEVNNLLDSDDIRHMLKALSQLGVKYSLNEDKTVCQMQGLGQVFQADDVLELFLGNAGTAMRPLTAALCASHGKFKMTGEPRMYERPIGDLIDALTQAGAHVEYLKDEGYPPMLIEANGLHGGEIDIQGNLSSQFLTAMLMAAPLCRRDVIINVIGELVSKPYIDITLDVMQRFGVQVENQQHQCFVIPSAQVYRSPGRIMVEGDASSASYFLAAAAIAGGPVRVHGVGKNSVQGDAKFAAVLEMMGAKVTWADEWIEVTGSGELHGVDVDLNHIPDAAMTIATTALFASGRTVIRNIYNWRVKETDRLAAMSTELRKLGAAVEEGEDYLIIDPPEKILSAAIDTYDDHRIAMCFSLAAFGDADITINDPGCTSKTFPSYFELFQSLTD
jgi:3-phosphoshikimate 1-carboxyvinyltransferase